MQYHSNTGEGSLSVFLAELVQRHLESVLAANALESLPEPVVVEPVVPESTPEPVVVESIPEPVVSEPAKLAGADVEGLIVGCSEKVKALAWKYADGSYDRVEELVSIGMLGVCEAAASLPAGFPDPQGYLCQAARHDMLDELYRLHACSTASLDALLSENGSFTLHDILPSLAVATVAPVSKRERALHDALDRLLARQQDAVRRRAGLPGYGVHSLEEIGRVVHASSAAAHALDQRGRRNLRRDAVLCEVMGVEVQS